MTDYTRRNFVKSLAATAAVLPTASRVFAQEAAPTVALALVGGAHIHAPGYLDHIKRFPACV